MRPRCMTPAWLRSCDIFYTCYFTWISWADVSHGEKLIVYHTCPGPVAGGQTCGATYQAIHCILIFLRAPICCARHCGRCRNPEHVRPRTAPRQARTYMWGGVHSRGGHWGFQSHALRFRICVLTCAPRAGGGVGPRTGRTRSRPTVTQSRVTASVATPCPPLEVFILLHDDVQLSYPIRNF
jgi:hypothetical protein